ncbi:hypothetical protein GCM10028774_66450 [Spirosoma jeollabukense]
MSDRPTQPLKTVDGSPVSLVRKAADTVYRPVKPDIVVPPVSVVPDLSFLSKQAGKTTIKYVAVGGKLSSGFRDGGLYREGQLTAFPNLIAHQMGIDSFQSPLFDPAQGNGTGYSVMTTKSPYPIWKQVENNRAISQEKPLKLVKYANGIPDNLAFPEGPSFVAAMPDNMISVYPTQRDYLAYYQRILTPNEENRVGLLSIITQKKPDFCTFEIRTDEFMGLAERPINLSTTYLMSSLDEGVVDQNILLLKNEGTKLVLFTVPPILDLPYFHVFPVNDLLDRNPEVFVRYKNNHINPVKADRTTLLLPTEAIRKTFLGQSDQGLSNANPFADEDVISADEATDFRAGISFYNEYYIRRAAKKHNIPLVDLDKVYQKILSNGYISDDGTPVSGTFPGGDFFSSDGRSPSAIGQAVIANETIKVINQHYATKIPLIDLKRFKLSLPQ